MKTWHRSPALVISLAVFSLVCGQGCGSAPRFDEADARQRLETFFPDIDRDTEILGHGAVDAERPSEYWVLLGQEMPKPDPSDVRRRSEYRDAAFPGEALLSFAVAVGVSDERLAASRQPVGQLWEWSTDEMSVRLRTVETDEGFLSVVERLP